MKIVVQTQVRENYAAHNGFTGEYAWKNKGGSTYVMPGLDWMDIESNKELAKKLCELVSENNDYFVEYVLDWSFEEDDAVCWEEWEADNIPHFTLNADGTWTKVIDMEGRYNYGLTKGHKVWHLDAEGEVITYEAKWYHPKFGWFAEADLPVKMLTRVENKKEILRSSERGSVFESYNLYRVLQEAA